MVSLLLPSTSRSAQCAYAVIRYRRFPAHGSVGIPLGVLLVAPEVDFAQARLSSRVIKHCIEDDGHRRYVQAWVYACRFHPPTSVPALACLANSLEERHSCLWIDEVLHAVGSPGLLLSTTYQHAIGGDLLSINLKEYW